MKKLILLLSFVLVAGGITFGQTQDLKKNFEIKKGLPTLYFTGTTPSINFNRGEVVITNTNANLLTITGGNLVVPSMLVGYSTTATAAGTTTLTVASNYLQYFTGATTQTVTLPVTSTLSLGQEFLIVNNSTGLVTVNSSGANAVIILGAGTSARVTCILITGTTAASWNSSYLGIGITSGKKLSASNTLTLAGTDATTMTFPSTSATIARTDAANTFTGNQTIVGTIGSGKVSSTAGVDLGTSQALTGTTAITIGSGTATTAITSSDWTVDATGIMANMGTYNGQTISSVADLTGTFRVTGVSTFTGGYALTTSSTHIWTAGGSVVLATAGTDAACSVGARYWSEIMIPYNVSLTGVSYLVGSIGATDSVVIQLVNSAGVEVATTKTTGANHAKIVGTAANFQSIPFAVAATPTPYAATAGLYYIVVQFNGVTAKFRTYPIPGSKFIAGTVAGTWGTKADITPGTTFTANVGPICITY